MSNFKDYKQIGEEYNIGSGDWLTLQDGENKVRIISEFIPYGNHFNPITKKSSICIGKEDCPACKEGLNPRVQFLGWVIDRKDKKIKLLRIGFTIFKQLGELAESEQYGFDGIPPYDVTIKKSGIGLATEYTTIADRKDTELTNDEKLQIEEKISDPKEIIEKMKQKQNPSMTISESIKEEDIPVIEEEEEINIKDIPF